jgi:hypothetical protein
MRIGVGIPSYDLTILNETDLVAPQMPRIAQFRYPADCGIVASLRQFRLSSQHRKGRELSMNVWIIPSFGENSRFFHPA